MRNIALKVVVTIISAPIAFYVGFIVTGMAYQRWEMPRLIKESPHDGQIGLAAWVTALYGGCACAAVVLAFGTYWTLRAIRQRRLVIPDGN